MVLNAVTTDYKRMSKHGLDLSSGEIWLDECATPIRPFTSLEEFLQTFKSIGAFRDPTQLKTPQLLSWPDPPPICYFKRTCCLLETHLSISLQFSQGEQPTLRNIRMFVRPKQWAGTISFLGKLRRLFTGNILSGLPKGFKSREQELVAYEQWLRATTGKTEHHQTYPWGELMLVYNREECYLFQINYSE